MWVHMVRPCVNATPDTEATLSSSCSPKHTIAAWGWQSSLAGWSFLDLTRPWLSKTATKYYLMLHLFKVTSLATLMSPSLTESKIHEASFPVHVSYARTNVNSKSSAVTTTHLWHLICIWVFTTCHIATQTCNSSTQGEAGGSLHIPSQSQDCKF